MSSPVYSRPAFMAHGALASKNVATRKGHLREVAAALHGFPSLAAMQAKEPLHRPATPHSTAVIFDRKLATDRCTALMPAANAELVVGEVARALLATASPGHFYLDNWADLPVEATQMARLCALAQPEMAGTTDDLEGRVLASLEHFAMGGEVIRGGANEGLLRRLSINRGPVELLHATSDPHVAGRILCFIGAYTPALGDGGIVHVDVIYQQITPAIYYLHSVGVLFRPGENYFDYYQ